MHPRTRIRNALYTRLESNDKLRALFNNRGRSVNETQVPYCNIMIGKESSEQLYAGYSETRNITVFINLVVGSGDNAPDELDDLSERVEELLLYGNDTLSDSINDIQYKGMSAEYDGAAQNDIAMMSLEFEISYIFTRNIEGEDLDEIAVEIDMASPRNDPQQPEEPDGQIDASAIIKPND